MFSPSAPSPMSTVSEKMERSDSFDSIPEIEFIQQMVGDELRCIDHVSKQKTLENMGELIPEPLLIPDKTRFVLFPIKHADVRNQES